MRTILVTGGTGFIGRNLVRKLDRCRLKLLVRNGTDIKGAELVYGDILNRDSLIKATKNVDIVYHCAGLLGGYNVRFKGLYRVNVLGTKNLLDACMQNKVTKFVYISSIAAMGDAEPNATEESQCRPISAYDKSKYLAEAAIKQSLVNAAIIRPATVYGPGETQNKARLFRLIQEGRFRIIGSGTNLFSLVYVDDLVDAIIASAKSRPGSCHIISNKPVMFKEFVNLIADAVGAKPPKSIPVKLAKTAAILMELGSRLFNTRPLLTRERIATLTMSRSFDTARAESELGFMPKVGLAEGIGRTVRWYRNIGVLK